jgi:hypothetical protein
MRKTLFAAVAILAALVLPAAHAQATGTLTINVIGKSTVANTAAYGTVVDALQARNSAGASVSGVSWSVNNPDFYTDFFGDLHTKWNNIISPGPQAMTITASAPGYAPASKPLTVTVTGTMAAQQMFVTTSQVGPVYDNSPPVTIAYSLVVSQEDGTIGNLASGVTWTSDNLNFTVSNTNTTAGTYYLTTTWKGTIAAGPQTVHLTAAAPGYTTADVAVTVQVLAP